MPTNHAPALLAAASRIQALAAKGKCEGVEIEGWDIPFASDNAWVGPEFRTPDEATPYDDAAIAWCLEGWLIDSKTEPAWSRGPRSSPVAPPDGVVLVIWHKGSRNSFPAPTHTEALLAALDAELAGLEGE